MGTDTKQNEPKDDGFDQFWVGLVGASIGVSSGVAVAAILDAARRGGIGDPSPGTIGFFLGASLAAGYWTLGWFHIRSRRNQADDAEVRRR